MTIQHQFQDALTSAAMLFLWLGDKIKSYMRHNGHIMAANGKTKSTPTPHPLSSSKVVVMDTVVFTVSGEVAIEEEVT